MNPRWLINGGTYLVPLLRLALSIGLVKVVADTGGYADLDALGLAVVHASFGIIPVLPWLTRLRGFMRYYGAERRAHLAWDLVLPAAFRSTAIFGMGAASIAWLLPGMFPKAGESMGVYLLVLCSASASTSLVPVEYLCGRFGMQGRLRTLELVIFVVIAMVSLAVYSPLLAACAAYISTLLARLTFALRSRPRGSSTEAHAKVFSLIAARRFLLASKGWMIMFGNIAQCSSSVIVYAYAFRDLPIGVVAQVSLAYRFAGPMQILSGQLAYVTWKRSDVRKAGFFVILMFGCASLLTLALPAFLQSFLGLVPSDDASVLGLIACAHIALQGFCQVKGSYLYAIKKYNVIALSAVPHACSAMLVPLVLFGANSGTATQVVLLLFAPTCIEFVVLWTHAQRSRL